MSAQLPRGAEMYKKNTFSIVMFIIGYGLWSLAQTGYSIMTFGMARDISAYLPIWKHRLALNGQTGWYITFEVGVSILSIPPKIFILVLIIPTSHPHQLSKPLPHHHHLSLTAPLPLGPHPHHRHSPSDQPCSPSRYD